MEVPFEDVSRYFGHSDGMLYESSECSSGLKVFVFAFELGKSEWDYGLLKIPVICSACY